MTMNHDRRARSSGVRKRSTARSRKRPTASTGLRRHETCHWSALVNIRPSTQRAWIGSARRAVTDGGAGRGRAAATAPRQRRPGAPDGSRSRCRRPSRRWRRRCRCRHQCCHRSHPGRWSSPGRRSGRRSRCRRRPNHPRRRRCRRCRRWCVRQRRDSAPRYRGPDDTARKCGATVSRRGTISTRMFEKTPTAQLADLLADLFSPDGLRRMLASYTLTQDISLELPSETASPAEVFHAAASEILRHLGTMEQFFDILEHVRSGKAIEIRRIAQSIGVPDQSPRSLDRTGSFAGIWRITSWEYRMYDGCPVKDPQAFWLQVEESILVIGPNAAEVFGLLRGDMVWNRNRQRGRIRETHELVGLVCDSGRRFSFTSRVVARQWLEPEPGSQQDGLSIWADQAAMLAASFQWTLAPDIADLRRLAGSCRMKDRPVESWVVLEPNCS